MIHQPNNHKENQWFIFPYKSIIEPPISQPEKAIRHKSRIRTYGSYVLTRTQVWT
ncbi:protein of unknown function [Paenibacillus alvei]|uniref:Uncharacterized protein n=1 Tax=Paenibacillus alvei TaxID=44250 RepID=A0A383R8N4_PAEAL|nr:protein of unknown function [Paenibacillus alvei]